MNKDAIIYVAGHRGMVGSAIWRKLEVEGYKNLIGKNSKELDLRDQQQVSSFFNEYQPEYVFLAAAKVGGIVANDTYKADFLYDNLMIQNNVIHESHRIGVNKLLFLGSSCIYPKMAPQPLKEEYLLSGFLEPTNEPYAIAKIAGLKMCEYYRQQYGCSFISAMPTNLYGPNDNYDLKSSHVIPALMRKFIDAKTFDKDRVEIWGTGTPLREFMHVDDLAAACLFLMLHYDDAQFVNIGSGEEISILGLAELVGELTGYEGELVFDETRPDGTPRKLMDSSKIASLGWKPVISLEEGLSTVINDYQRD